MNDVNARSVPVMGGYEGQFRKVHRSEWEPVRRNGIAEIFETADAAEVAAWRALRGHICGDIVGSGDKAALARIEAGKLFPGKGRVVEVVRR